MLRRLCFLLSFAGCLFAYCASSAANNSDVLDSIVAIVNDQVITQSALNQEIETETQAAKTSGNNLSSSEIRKNALNNLIDFDVQLQTAKLAKVQISDDRLNEALSNIAKQHNLTLQQLPAALASQHINYDDFKKQITNRLMVQTLQQQQLAGTIKLDPKQVDALAKKLATQKPTSVTEYHLIDLLLALPPQPSQDQINATQQKLNEIAKDLNAGQNFADIAQKMSSDPTHTDLGWRAQNEMPQAFADLVSKLKTGQVSQPLRAPNGVHLIQVAGTRQSTATDAINDSITETHVRHILIKTDALTPSSSAERRLLNIRDQLMHGGDFAKLAQENSQDPGSVSQGGDIGWVKPGILDPKFEKAMDALKVGEISMPVQSQFGWHLIQVLDRKKTNDHQEALHMQAQQMLFEQKMAEAIKNFISMLRAQSYIKIIDNK